MQSTDHRIFPLNLDSLRLRQIVRAMTAVLVLVMVSNSVAVAAGGPKGKTAMDPAKLKQALTDRGIGKGIRATELNGTQETGTLTAIHDDTFEVIPKNETKSVVISYTQVSAVHSNGMNTGTKVAIGAGIGAAALFGVLLLLFAAHK